MSGLITRLRESSAAREGLHVLAAQGLATAIALGIDILLFRELPKNERGMLSTTLALRNIMLYIADMGLALTTVRVGAEYFGRGLVAEAHTIFRRALFSRMALTALVIAIALLLTPALSGAVLAAGSRHHLVWAAALALFGMSATSWGVDVSRSTRSFRLYFAHQVVEAALKASAVVALVVIINNGGTPSAEPVVWALAASATVAGLFSVLIQRDVFREHAPLLPEAKAKLDKQLKDFGRFAWAIALIATVGTQVEVFLIQNLLKPEDTAVFDGARRLALVLPLIAGTMTTVLLPRAAVLDTLEGCAAYVRKALVVSVILAIFCAGGLALGAGFIIPLLWSHKYDDSIPLLHWLCAANGLMIIINPLALVFYPLQRIGLLLAIHLVSLLLSIVLGLLLIPRFGLAGAVWAALLVKVVSLILFSIATIAIFRSSKLMPSGMNAAQECSDLVN